MITGYINFPSPGIYWFKIFANDGVRLVIGGIMLYEDSEPYPDCERRGSWAIEFSWQQDGGFSTVPASHFTHLEISKQWSVEGNYV